jgi:Ca2+/Na+ antiporter
MHLNPQVNFASIAGVFVFLIISTIIYFVLLHKKNLTKKDGWWLFVVYAMFIIYLAIIA